jgi:hypothetical protein
VFDNFFLFLRLFGNPGLLNPFVIPACHGG